MKNIIKILLSVGPGLFLIGYNIGTGSVTTMAKVGAEHGMSLTWALLLSCIFTYVLMVAYGKTTLVTGHTALYTIKGKLKFGKYLAIYIMIALVIGELLALMGIMGIVSDLLNEAIIIAFGYKVKLTLWISLLIIICLYGLFWNGQYKLFEKILTLFVILMGLSFIGVFFLVKPSISEIITGLIPSIPNKPGAYSLVAAIAGTTCSAAVFIMRSTVVAEKGWDISNLKIEKKDSAISSSVMFFLSFIIMAVSAGTLHMMGINLTNTVDMIHLFEPIGGKVAAFILILGISAAGISTVFPIILIAPWLISDYMGKERNIKSTMYRVLGFIGILFGLVIQFIDERPPIMMIFSQAFQALILPAVAIPIFILINNENIMGKYKAGKKMSIGIIGVIIFSFITSYFAIADLLN